MSEIRTLFRFCPACGKRFEVRLQSRKLLDERLEQTEITKESGSLGLGYGQPGYAMSQPVVVEEKVPITVDVEEFQYTYRCKHCLAPDVEIVTSEGMKRIADVKVGELVLTHLGRYRPIAEIIRHDFQGRLLQITASHAPNSPVVLSPDHPIFAEWLKEDSSGHSHVLQDALLVKPAESL